MKSLVLLLVVLFAAPCFSQERYPLRSYRDYSNSTAHWSINPPKIYSEDGTYLGELSQNRYAPDSVNNRFGVYGSRYSSESINNRYGEFGRYRTQPIYVYPR